MSKHYSKIGKAEDYIIELVQINVKYLFTVTNEDDSAVVKDFVMFLKDYVLKHRKSINFAKLANFDKIRVSMCFSCNIFFNLKQSQLKSVNKFKRIVVDIIAEVCTVYTYNIFVNFRSFITCHWTRLTMNGY